MKKLTTVVLTSAVVTVGALASVVYFQNENLENYRDEITLGGVVDIPDTDMQELTGEDENEETTLNEEQPEEQPEEQGLLDEEQPEPPEEQEVGEENPVEEPLPEEPETPEEENNEHSSPSTPMCGEEEHYDTQTHQCEPNMLGNQTCEFQFPGSVEDYYNYDDSETYTSIYSGGEWVKEECRILGCKEGYQFNEAGECVKEELEELLESPSAGGQTLTTYANEISYGTTTKTATLTGDSSTMNNFTYKTITVGDYVLMDRNLGATEEWTYTDDWSTHSAPPKNSYGYYYQWGNNYGFSPATESAGASSPITVADEYMPSKYSSPNWNTAQPWSTQNNLWGDDTNTTIARQGPCPYGWHVPSKSEWSAIQTAWQSASNKTSTSETGKDFAKDLKLPPAGYRNFSSLSFSNLGDYGRYWSSTPSSSNGAYNLYFMSSGINPQDSDYRSYGFSVRCVQSFPTQTLTFHANGGTMSETTKEVDKGTTTTAPADPVRAHSDFVRWYTDPELTQGFSFATPINEDLDLYAKYTCEGGYVEAEDHQSCIDNTPPTISFTDDVSSTYVQIDTILVDWGDATVKKYMLADSECSSNANDYTATNEVNLSIAGTELYNGKYLCLYAEDEVGNSVILKSENSIHIDMTAPTGTISINNSASYTNDVNVTLTLAAVDTGSSMGQMKFSCNGATWSDWENYNTTKSWNLTSGNGCELGDGEKIVRARFKDLAGNISAETTSIILVDTVAPTGSISLDNGAQYTNNSLGKVSITLSGSDEGAGMGKMQFTCDRVNGPWSNLKDFKTTESWTFQSGYGCNGSEGEKTLYVRLEDNAGNSEIFSDSIIYDKTAPTGSITINNGAEYTNNNQVSIRMIASDGGSGMGKMHFSCNGTNWTDLANYHENDTWTFASFGASLGCDGLEGEKTLYVEYQDNAGNTATFSDSIIYDKTAPALEFTNDVSADYVRFDEVVVNWGDATVKKWRYSESSTCSTTESDYDKTDSDEMGQITEANNGKYICLYAKDAAGNASTKASTNTFHIDATAPTGTISINNNANYTNNANITLTLAAVDTGSLMGQMRFSCNGVTWSSWETYTTSKNWNLNTGNGCTSGDGEKTVNVQYKDNVGNTETYSDTITLDTINPICTITGNPGEYTNSPVELTVNYVAETNPLADGYSWNGETYTSTKTHTATSNSTYTAYVKDAAGNIGSCNVTVNKIDTTKPTSQLATTSTLKTNSQTVGFSCSDTVGVKGYYFGTKNNPGNEDYTVLATPETEVSDTVSVTSAGTYYFFCKDVAGNVSDAKSETYYTYEVHNMLNAIDKSEGDYNTTNYPQSTTNTYLAPAGTSIVFANVYTIPTYSLAAKYVGYTTSNSGTPSQANSVELTGNATYYMWFNRNTYQLSLVKSTGIANIYYKVNGATEYTSASSSTSVDMKAGSTVKVYAVASAGYTYTETSSTSPIEWTEVNADKEFNPTASLNSYTISYVDSLNATNTNPTSYNVTTQDITLADLSKVGYTFEGWYTESTYTNKVTGVAIAQGTTGNKMFYAKWSSPISYTISYDLDGGILVGAANPTSYTIETATFTLNNPSKEGYTFVGWTGSNGDTAELEVSIVLGSTGDKNFTAVWKEIDQQNQNSTASGGGGRRIIPKTPNNDIEHESAGTTEEHELVGDEADHKTTENKGITPSVPTTMNSTAQELTTLYPKIESEVVDAYDWAYQNNITTQTPKDSDPNGYVKRGHMAKMVVNYAMNILGKKLPERYPDECKRSDDAKEWESKEIKGYAEKACALGLMGVDTKYFNPKKDVTRAQFGTVLSRMLWGDEFNLKDSKEKPYYTNHLGALKKNGIMTIIDNPTKMKELRQWVWLMLYRTKAK